MKEWKHMRQKISTQRWVDTQLKIRVTRETEEEHRHKKEGREVDIGWSIIHISMPHVLLPPYLHL